jgi:hypothetical protein
VKVKLKVNNALLLIKPTNLFYVHVVSNTAWDNIRENIKISAQESLGCCEPKHRKPWFDEGFSKLVDQRKQAKLQVVAGPK